MKKCTLVLITILFCLSAIGQSISVSSFRNLETDMTANTAGTMEKDQNGEVAALIKVVTTQTGFSFDCGSLGIVRTIQKPSEIWVYVPRSVKKMTISHPQLGLLRDYYFPIPIDAARTYEMVIVSGTVQTFVQQVRTAQYVVFQLTPSNAQVDLDGVVLETREGTATKMMKFGTYNYRVQAPNYLPEAGNITIDDPKNKKIVNIKLKPNFSTVTVSVNNDAEIWINGIKKGKGIWTGNLSKGTYEFEAKLQGHRSSIVTKDIIVSSDPQTINLQAPFPIYGELEISSKPAFADIFVDGKKIGQTPQVCSNLLIGPHQIRICRNNYLDYITNIDIKENEISTLSVSLEEKKTITSNYPHTALIDTLSIDVSDIDITYNKKEVKKMKFLGDITDRYVLVDENGKIDEMTGRRKSEECTEKIKKKCKALGGRIVLLNNPYPEGRYMVKPAKAYK